MVESWTKEHFDIVVSWMEAAIAAGRDRTAVSTTAKGLALELYMDLVDLEREHESH